MPRTKASSDQYLKQYMKKRNPDPHPSLYDSRFHSDFVEEQRLADELDEVDLDYNYGDDLEEQDEFYEEDGFVVGDGEVDYPDEEGEIGEEEIGEEEESSEDEFDFKTTIPVRVEPPKLRRSTKTIPHKTVVTYYKEVPIQKSVKRSLSPKKPIQSPRPSPGPSSKPLPVPKGRRTKQ